MLERPAMVKHSSLSGTPVESLITSAQDVPSQKLTQLFTIFAQFVDHDLTLAATYTVPSNKTIKYLFVTDALEK